MRNNDGTELKCNHMKPVAMLTFLGELKSDSPRLDFPELEKETINRESGIRDLTKQEYLLEQIAIGLQMIAEEIGCNNENSLDPDELSFTGTTITEGNEEQ